VVVDLDSLLGHPGAVGGEAGGAEPLAPAACRRLACDGALTRVLVSRHLTTHHGHDHRPNANHQHQHQPTAAPRAKVGPPAAD
jgi:hypothetical protein